MTDVKILVVEDEVELNDAYRKILGSAGYSVKSAYNGAEALETIKNDSDPHIILLDLRMPVLDGIGFLKKYNAPAHKDTTIVLFSNYEAQEEVDEAYNLGAHHYILKAMASPKELLHSIEMILRQKAKA
jgi:CheY-like chemotaxis protein